MSEYDTCDEMDELRRCECGKWADVAIDGEPECPSCLSERTDRTGSWNITAKNSRQRILSGTKPRVTDN